MKSNRLILEENITNRITKYDVYIDHDTRLQTMHMRFYIPTPEHN